MDKAQGTFSMRQPAQQEMVLSSMIMGFPSGSVVKNALAKAGDTRDVEFNPWVGRNPEGGISNPFQYSGQENPIDREA